MSSRKNFSISLQIGLLAGILLCSGCIKVAATSPSDGTTGVKRDTVIQVAFNMAAKPASVNTETFLVEDSLGNPVAGTVTYSNKIAVFTPASALVLRRNYMVTLTTGIKDIIGFALKANYSFGFTTIDHDWGTAQQIDENITGDAGEPQIAVDADGNAIAVWQQYGCIWSDFYSKANGWNTALLIEKDDTQTDSRPQIAANDYGYAAAVWIQYDGIQYSIRSNCYIPGTGWGLAQTIETDTGYAENPQIAVDTGGNAIAVWQQYDGTRNNIWSNRFTPVSGWGPAQLIESDNGYAENPQIAVDADGNAIAVWYQNGNIWSNRYTPDNGWDTAQLVEANDGAAYMPQVAVNADGHAVAIWTQYDGTRYRIWSNSYLPGIGWSTAQPIEADNTGDATYPQAAIEATGNALAVWQQYDGIQNNIWSNRYICDSGWGIAQLIETDSGDAGYPHISMDADGNAIVVWEQHDGTRYNIRSARHIPANGWGTAQLIEMNDTGDAMHPQIAADSNGNANAVWNQYDGTSYSIWHNRFE